MHLNRLLTASAAFVLIAGAAHAQAPAAAPAAAAPAAAPVAPVVASGDVVETLKASGQFTMLLKYTDATNLTGFLKARPNITLFAPTDAAFAAIPEAERNRLMSNIGRGDLQKMLIYHVVNARVPSSEFKDSVRSAPTLAGLPVTLNGEAGKLLVNDADVVQADVMASNGVIQVIDKVLSPGTAPAVPATGADASATAAAPAANTAMSAQNRNSRAVQWAGRGGI
jgi:uncharacterized surface protein with fasciclin (FAS1) repeats